MTQQIARVPRASGVFAGSLGGEGMALWVGPAVFLFSVVSTSCQSPQIFRCWFVGATYKKVMLRDAWVKRLDENTTELSYTNEEKNDLLKWARTFKMTTEDLEVCLSKKSWRKGLMKTNN